MRKFLALLLFFICTLPAFPADQKAGADDRIFDQVRMRLATDADVKGGNFDVTVKDGVVTLKGRVDTEKGKSRASKLAKKVKGVKQVENDLMVGPPTSD
ncbi:MAG: BON domain-containing protein [Bryobacteraceae bacterium]